VLHRVANLTLTVDEDTLLRAREPLRQPAATGYSRRTFVTERGVGEVRIENPFAVQSRPTALE
jgi:hypothetical protein